MKVKIFSCSFQVKNKILPDEPFDNIFSNVAPASWGSMTAGMCMSRSVSSGSQTIL